MELLLHSMLDSLTLMNIQYVALGVTIGIVVGAIPGLNGPMAIALAVPLTYYMPTVAALGFLIGINKGGAYGGSVAAILLNTPGTPESAATSFDGYPLNRKGKALKAMKMALFASVFGDTFSNLLLICVAAPVASVAIKLGPVEVCAIVILALTIISSVESESMVKGLIAATFGMLVSCVGIDSASSLPRLTFGLYQLENGIPLLAITIGLLALSEILVQTETPFSMQESAKLSLSPRREDNLLPFKEFISCWRTLFRSSIIGAVIGALPGLGATVAAFMGYSYAKNASKHPERYGTGEIDGVAAPEAANNAVIGANLIPLFTLGIPGNVAAAILIGAFIVHGIQPGPLMFEKHAATVYGIYGTMLIGNVLNLFIGYIGLRIFIKVLAVPKQLLFPILMFVCLVGSYIGDNIVFYVYIMIFFTLIGYLMKKLKFSFVTFIIGFVLGPMFELSLNQTLVLSDNGIWILFTQPIACAIMICSAVTIVRNYYRYKKGLAQSFHATAVDDVS